VDEFVVGKIDLAHGAQPDLPDNAVAADGLRNLFMHGGDLLLAEIAVLSD
jgi:hypothetical protein